MGIGARYPLPADRNTPFARTFRFVGGPALTGANLQGQIRLYSDAPGAPLVNLPMTTSSTATGFRLVDVNTDGPKAVSRFTLFISQAVMQALPPAPRPGGDLVLHWDLHVTPAGGIKQRRLFGEFIVQGGVTR